MSVQAQSADGVIHEFPDGTDPGVIDRAMKQYAASPQQAAAEARTAGTERLGRNVRAQPMKEDGAKAGDVVEGAHALVRGANRGLGNVVTAPLDASVNAKGELFKNITGIDVPKPSEVWRTMFQNERKPDETQAQKVLGNAGEMLGENVPLMLGGAAAAATRIPAITPSVPATGLANTFKSAADEAAKWIAGNPGKWAAANTAGPIEASVGGDVAKETAAKQGVGPTGQRTAEIAGQFLTPPTVGLYSKFGPGALAVRGAAKIGRKALDVATEHMPGGLENMLPESLRPAPGSATAAMADRVNARAAERTNAKVGPELREITARPDNAARSAESEAVSQEIPGFNPTLAKKTGDQGLVNLQRDFESKATGDELRGMQERTDTSARAIRDYAKTAASPSETISGTAVRLGGEVFTGPSHVDAVKAAAKHKGITYDQAVDLLLNQGGADAQGFVTSAGRYVGRREALEIADRGKQIQGLKPSRLEAGSLDPELLRTTPSGPLREKPPEDVVHMAAQRRIEAAQGRVEGQQQATEGQLAQRSDLPEADVTNIGHQMRRVRSAEEEASQARVNQLRANIGQPNAPVTITGADGNPTQTTLREALDRRAQINQDLRDYYSATNKDVGAVRQIRRLQAERDDIEAAIGHVNDPGFQEFNRYYREEHVPRFMEGASRDVGRYSQNNYGKNKVVDEDVAGKFFGPNNVSEARQWNRLYGDTPQMRQQMTDHALDDLRRTSTDPTTGMLKKGAVDKWLQQRERLLNEMPWIREAVEARNPNDLYGRIKQLEGREKAVAETKIGKLLSKNGTPESTVDAALNDWQIMRSLKRSVQGDANSERALTKAVWDRAVGAGGEETLLDAGKLREFMNGHQRSLREVLTPEHMRSLETITRAAEIEGRVPRAVGTAEKPRSAMGAVEKITGTSVPTAATTATTLARGRSNPIYEGGRIVLNLFNKLSAAEANRVWKEVIYNPEVARTVAAAVKNGKATPMQERQLYKHMYMLSVAGHDAADKDERK